MSEHPIEGLMTTAMNSIQDMIDVNTIIGEPIQSMNGITIIPISKVSFGFAAGGSEFSGETIKQYRMKDKDEEIEYKLPFGGGAGAGVSINPVYTTGKRNSVWIFDLDGDRGGWFTWAGIMCNTKNRLWHDANCKSYIYGVYKGRAC